MTPSRPGNIGTTDNGNVFLYVLIAVALFAGVTMVITRSQQSNETNNLTKGEERTRIERLNNYVGQAGQVWVQMENTGSDLDELDLTLPSDAGFNTPPVIHKFFHPYGGGLTYNAMNESGYRNSAAAPVGWHFVLVNADWTASSGTDLVMTYININKSLCAALNEKITGSNTIPAVTVDYTDTFIDGTTALQASECAECETYPSLCVVNGGVYAFYNLIAQR